MSILRRLLAPAFLAGLLTGCVYSDPYAGQGYGYGYATGPSYGYGYGYGPSYGPGYGYGGGYGGWYGYGGEGGDEDGDWHHHRHHWQGWGD